MYACRTRFVPLFQWIHPHCVGFRVPVQPVYLRAWRTLVSPVRVTWSRLGRRTEGETQFTALVFISGVGFFTDSPEVVLQVLGEAEVAVFRPSNFVFLADHPTLRVRNLCPIFLRCRKAGARDGALAILKIDSRFRECEI